jgi:predicted RNA-binding Zn-ribbon protein involved in translation (DUF1610 family)
MRICPYCGQLLNDNGNKCTKCGAILSAESGSNPFQCPKCGGVLKGTEMHCPWCGFPCVNKHVEETEAYQVLKSLENALREFIQEKLTSVDNNWWDTRIPEEVRKEASRRKLKDERLYPWHVQEDLPLIYYVNFSDYAKIIVLDKNWDQVFKRVFKEKLFIVTKLRELEPIRSAIAHMRDIGEKDLQKLKLYSEEIMSCISPTSKLFNEEILHYSEVIAKVDVDYGVLRIRYSETNPDILQMELERGRICDVIKPKPVIGTIEFPFEKRLRIEESIRRLLQVIAREHWAEIGMEILHMGKLQDIINKVGELMYGLFPTCIKQQLAEMPSGSLLTLALEDKVVGLPWELACDDADFLATKFGIGRVIYSDGRLFQRRKSRPETRILLVSNPDGSLFSDVKVATLLKEKMQKVGVFVDHFTSEAEGRFYTSKDNLLAALKSGLYDVVHFIGHGGYNPRHPEKSSFAVADGYIFAEDISQALDETISSGKDPPFLFFAHSCEAGAQRSWDLKSYESQVLGLSTAFLLHNVAYIGAIWAAEFREEEIWGSDRLALAFYDELLDRKQPLGLALRNAKLSLKKEGDSSYEWANFVLYGDPSLIIKI